MRWAERRSRLRTRDRRPAPPHRGPHRLAGAPLRPDLPDARPARLPRRGRDHAAWQAAGPDLVRERPGHRRVPAGRYLGRAGPRATGAVVSTLIYEPRRDERPLERMPDEAVRDALAETVRVWAAVVDGRGRARACRPAANPNSGSCGRCTDGLAANASTGRWLPLPRPDRNCRPVTSCAGASRCSTCWSSCRACLRRAAKSRRSPPPRGRQLRRCGAASWRRACRPEDRLGRTASGRVGCGCPAIRSSVCRSRADTPTTLGEPRPGPETIHRLTTRTHR